MQTKWNPKVMSACILETIFFPFNHQPIPEELPTFDVDDVHFTASAKTRYFIINEIISPEEALCNWEQNVQTLLLDISICLGPNLENVFIFWTTFFASILLILLMYPSSTVSLRCSTQFTVYYQRFHKTELLLLL